ncbi:MAG: hypothetical protein AB1512_07960 [Thermodesulfobacteriota bacterium]
MGSDAMLELRQYRRFTAREDAFAVLRNQVNEVGQLINVSKGGLAFKYMAERPLPSDSYQLDIFLAGTREFLWRSIPHRTILDMELPPIVPFSVIRMRRRSVAFENLTEDHSLRLELLLELSVGLDLDSASPLA